MNTPKNKSKEFSEELSHISSCKENPLCANKKAVAGVK